MDDVVRLELQRKIHNDLEKNDFIMIFNILKEHNINYTVTKNSISFNSSEVDIDIINKINKFVDNCIESKEYNTKRELLYDVAKKRIDKLFEMNEQEEDKKDDKFMIDHLDDDSDYSDLMLEDELEDNIEDNIEDNSEGADSISNSDSENEGEEGEEEN